MACQQTLLLVLLVAAIPMAAMAKQWVVGDEKGWAQKFDYVTWAKMKDFQVGDTLVFNYPKGDNVVKVDENGFKNCRVEAGKDQPMSSGKDTVTLDSAGKMYFISAVEKHCEKGGQKVAVEVKAASPGSRKEGPSPAPAGDDKEKDKKDKKDDKEKDKKNDKEKDKKDSGSAPSEAPSGGSGSSSPSSSPPSPSSSSAPGGAPSNSESAACRRSGYQMSLAVLVAILGVLSASLTM